ncbi:MAG: flagellar FlbD family protein [Lachnospirales bacterium]
MIYVKKINGTDMVLNCELIESIEANPDTTITLISGKKIILSDNIETVIRKVIEYKRQIMINDLNV